MALNINYQGGVYNDLNEEITCFYQAFVPSINRWGTIRETEESQFNINYGDGDLKGQSGSVSNGETILIAFWIGAATRSEELNSFSVLAFSYSGSDSTVQNAQILSPHSPSCSFGLATEGKVGQAVTANSYASLTYQWTFQGKAHYQRPSWYGGSVFAYLSILDDSFRFTDDFQSSNTHTYTTHGDYTVFHRVINSYNMQSVCQKNIRIRYRTPIGGILFSPQNLVIGDPIGVAATIQDIDSRITSINHMFDGSTEEINTDIDFVYAKTLTIFRPYIARQEIHWNDGFQDLIVIKQASPTMVNQPPLIDLTVFKTEEDGLEGLHKAIVQASDREGPVVKLVWKIFFLDTNSILPNPYFRCIDDGLNDTFNEIYSDETPVTTIMKDLLFAIKGVYKIDVTAYDEQGLYSTDSQTITVDEVCLDEGTPEEECEDLEERIAEAIAQHERENELMRAAQRREDLKSINIVTVTDVLADDMEGGTLAGESYNPEPVGGTDYGIGSEVADGNGDSSSISGG